MKKVTHLLFTTVLCSTFLLGSCDRGEDYKQNDDASSAEYNEDEAMYPEEKVQDDTNLEDGDPLSMEGGSENIEKRILMASLLRQKTDIEDRIREMKMQPVSVDASSPAGNLNELEGYVAQLDKEITQVRRTPDNRLSQIQKSAMSTIEEAGALLQTTYIRVDRGF
ncbi:MAG: hypothetical protein RIG62_23840 [Cyclobacteriaceae bacterium]